MKKASEDPLTKAEFEALSEFRFHIRRFERFSEDAVQACGITPLQYLLLLHVKGFPGRDHASIGELAERLQAKHHGVVALVTRCEEAGYVARRADPADRRRVGVHLTAAGERSLATVFPIARINAGDAS
jgi:DNA-binding MarR family transcriptional regulator